MNIVRSTPVVLLVSVAVAVFLLVQIGSAVSTFKEYDRLTAQSTVESSPTPTPVPTHTPVPTSIPSPTPKPTQTPTPVPTATQVPTATVTPTPEPTATHAPTPEPSPTPSPTPQLTIHLDQAFQRLLDKRQGLVTPTPPISGDVFSRLVATYPTSEAGESTTTQSTQAPAVSQPTAIPPPPPTAVPPPPTAVPVQSQPVVGVVVSEHLDIDGYCRAAYGNYHAVYTGSFWACSDGQTTLAIDLNAVASHNVPAYGLWVDGAPGYCATNLRGGSEGWGIITCWP